MDPRDEDTAKQNAAFIQSVADRIKGL
jgi:hypothetical protein